MEENLDLFDRAVKKASQEKKQYLTFCPDCGSTNVKPKIYGMGKDAVALSPQMRCVDCGFYGFVMEATPEKLIEYRKQLKEKSNQ